MIICILSYGAPATDMNYSFTAVLHTTVMMYYRVQIKWEQWRNFQRNTGAAWKLGLCWESFKHIGVGRTPSHRPTLHPAVLSVSTGPLEAQNLSRATRSCVRISFEPDSTPPTNPGVKSYWMTLMFSLKRRKNTVEAPRRRFLLDISENTRSESFPREV